MKYVVLNVHIFNDVEGKLKLGLIRGKSGMLVGFCDDDDVE